MRWRLQGATGRRGRPCCRNANIKNTNEGRHHYDASRTQLKQLREATTGRVTELRQRLQDATTRAESGDDTGHKAM